MSKPDVYNQCGRDFSPPFDNYWGGLAADPVITNQMMPGDIYFNMTSKTLKVVNTTHDAWISVGPPKVGDDFTDGALNEYKWKKDVAGAGTVVILTNEGEVDGAVRLRDTGAAVDNHAGINMNTNRCIQKAKLSVYRVRLKLSTILNTDGVRCRVILHHDGAFNAVGDWFGFEFDAAVHANWRLKSTIAGAAVKDVNTTIPAAANTWVELSICMFNGSGIAYAYINDVYVGLIAAADLTTDPLEVNCSVDDNNVAAGHNIDAIIDYIFVYQ